MITKQIPSDDQWRLLSERIADPAWWVIVVHFDESLMFLIDLLKSCPGGADAPMDLLVFETDELPPDYRPVRVLMVMKETLSPDRLFDAIQPYMSPTARSMSLTADDLSQATMLAIGQREQETKSWLMVRVGAWKIRNDPETHQKGEAAILSEEAIRTLARSAGDAGGTVLVVRDSPDDPNPMSLAVAGSLAVINASANGRDLLYQACQALARFWIETAHKAPNIAAGVTKADEVSNRRYRERQAQPLNARLREACAAPDIRAAVWLRLQESDDRVRLYYVTYGRTVESDVLAVATARSTLTWLAQQPVCGQTGMLVGHDRPDSPHSRPRPSNN